MCSVDVCPSVLVSAERAVFKSLECRCKHNRTHRDTLTNKKKVFATDNIGACQVWLPRKWCRLINGCLQNADTLMTEQARLSGPVPNPHPFSATTALQKSMQFFLKPNNSEQSTFKESSSIDNFSDPLSYINQDNWHRDTHTHRTME